METDAVRHRLPVHSATPRVPKKEATDDAALRARALSAAFGTGKEEEEEAEEDEREHET